MKTNAAILRNVGGPLSIEELEIPGLLYGQVLVKILASGLCHSQLNEISGRKGKEYIPHLLGHEASGIVVDCGDGVKKVKKNDYVAISWIKDGNSGKFVSAGSAATFTEYAVVSENRVFPITREIEPSIVALLGCAVLTGAGIAKNLKIQHGSSVAIFGIGGIGSNALLKAKSLGARVTAIDIVEWKVKWVKEELGVEAILPSEINSRKFDFVIECSGAKEAMEKAFEVAEDHGMVVLAGNLPSGTSISIDPFGLIKGKKLSGSWGGGSFPDKDISEYVGEYLNGSLPLEKLISKEYHFDQINEGLKDLESGKLIRGIVLINNL
jgi:S-(hydroxymethyl)glutathione dehydrogenase / alcohol dehydrogenase